MTRQKQVMDTSDPAGAVGTGARSPELAAELFRAMLELRERDESAFETLLDLAKQLALLSSTGLALGLF